MEKKKTVPLTAKAKARRNLSNHVKNKNGENAWTLKTYKKLQTYWLSMHLKHYANCELGSGLADCTNWSHEHRPIHKQNFTIDFKDWLTKQKEKHLFADLSQDTIQAVIRVALSGAELDQTLFQNEMGLAMLDAKYDPKYEAMLSSHLNHECRNPHHHLVSGTCKSHLTLLDTIHMRTTKPVCCTCLTMKMTNQQITQDQTLLDITSDIFTDDAIADTVPSSNMYSKTEQVLSMYEKTTSITKNLTETTQFSLVGLTSNLPIIDETTLPDDVTGSRLSDIKDDFSETIVPETESLPPSKSREVKEETIPIPRMEVSEEASKQPSNGQIGVSRLQTSTNYVTNSRPGGFTVDPDPTVDASQTELSEVASKTEQTVDASSTEQPPDGLLTQEKPMSPTSYTDTDPATHNRTAPPESEPSFLTDPVISLPRDQPVHQTIQEEAPPSVTEQLTDQVTQDATYPPENDTTLETDVNQPEQSPRSAGNRRVDGELSSLVSFSESDPTIKDPKDNKKDLLKSTEV